MRNLLTLLIVFLLALGGNAQNKYSDKPFKNNKISPTEVSKAVHFSISKPLRDLPSKVRVRTEEEQKAFKKLKQEKEGLNFSMKYRQYPHASTAKPFGLDPILQNKKGWNPAHKTKEPILNFAGQDAPYQVSDCNGAAGPNHYMQAVNTSYAIWDKQGNQVVAPTDFNTLFQGVPGANVNDGDPIVIYDDNADRWLAAEFSGAYSNPDYMLIAVSETNDPTGAWYRWSFSTNGFPDYMKFGIWRDGYYMGTNTGQGSDIYVFERDAMLAGEASPKMVAFDNQNRPNSGFHCVLPLDNDGAFAPEGTPGQFITINDDAWGGSSNDQLWVYELNVDWQNVENSTFERTQQIPVAAFDSNFGNTWANLPQLGTSQKIDAVPSVLMYRAQYRNFGDYQTIVCAHTVDVNGNNHAGIRWYELINTGFGWDIRQQGTYAPDNKNRWIPAISMDKNHNIALGYTYGSAELHPGIRYCGQSANENINASGLMDIAEEVVWTGIDSHTSDERWADYAGMCVDPSDDETFWFTTEYADGSYNKSTRIVNFKFDPPTIHDKDAGILGINLISGSNFSTSESVQVIVKNYGSNPISNFPISLQFNNEDIITELITQTIAGDSNYTYTFATTVDLSDLGDYNFKLFTGLEGDENHGNDTLTKIISHFERSYCPASGGNGYEYISKVEFANISKTSNETEYSDFTDIVADVEKGETYSFIMNIEGAYDNDEGFVWIDWNQDFNFDEDEKYFVGSGTNLPYTKDITVPEDAVSGITRMRVRLHDSSFSWMSTPNDGPCGESSYGEVEDYSVNIASTTSVSSVYHQNMFSVLPNPANEKLVVSLHQSSYRQIEIVDVNGKIIDTFDMTHKTEKTLNTSAWSEGVYFVRLKNNQKEVQSIKLIVKH